MADIIYTENGLEQYLEWQSEDKKTLKRSTNFSKA